MLSQTTEQTNTVFSSQLSIIIGLMHDPSQKHIMILYLGLSFKDFFTASKYSKLDTKKVPFHVGELQGEQFDLNSNIFLYSHTQTFSQHFLF